jgi:hypothetical protein
MDVTRTQTDDAEAFPLAPTFERFFETKTARDVEGTMSFFSPDLVSHIDATLGWDLDGQLRTPAEAFPGDLKDARVATRAAPGLAAAASDGPRVRMPTGSSASRPSSSTPA